MDPQLKRIVVSLENIPELIETLIDVLCFITDKEQRIDMLIEFALVYKTVSPQKKKEIEIGIENMMKKRFDAFVIELATDPKKPSPIQEHLSMCYVLVRLLKKQNLIALLCKQMDNLIALNPLLTSPMGMPN